MHYCPLCLSKEIVLITTSMPFSMRSDGLILNESLKKYHCFACGGMTGDNTQNSAPYRRTNGKSSYDIKRHEAIAIGISKLISSLTNEKSPNILEIGGASFETASQLKKLNDNYKIYALEPHPENDSYKSIKNINTLITSIEKFETKIKYDFIFSNNVIEHIADTRNFLINSKKLLKKNGILIVCCPTQKFVSNEILFTDHLYHLTTNSISKCCDDLDLTVIAENNSTWDPFTHIFLIINKNKENKNIHHNINTKSLYLNRINLLLKWSKQDGDVRNKIKSQDSLYIYGAGEFTQLISCYLPETFRRAKEIYVDDLNGIRYFVKPIKLIEDLRKQKNTKILIGSQFTSRKIMKSRLRNLGYNNIDFIDIEV